MQATSAAPVIPAEAGIQNLYRAGWWRDGSVSGFLPARE